MPGVMRVGLLLILTVAAVGGGAWFVLQDDGDVSETGNSRAPSIEEPRKGDESDPARIDVTPGETRPKDEPSVILLTGLVKGRAGQPIQDADVLLLRDGMTRARTRSLANGRFILEGPTGSLPMIHVGAAGHSSRAFVDLPTGSDVVVVLDKAVAFRGTISDAGGNPMGRALVTLTPRGRPDLAPVSAESGSKGRFRIDRVAPGRWDVTVSKDGFAPVHDTMLVIPPPDGLERDYVLDTGITLKGTITTDDGRLVVAGAQIEVIDRIVGGRPIQNQSRRLGPYVSRGDGTFEIPALLPGTLVLLVKGRGFGATFHAHQIRKDDARGPVVTIDLPRVAKFGGTVFDPAGKPVRDALVVIVPDGMDRSQFEQVSSFLFGAESWDDGAGARWPAVRSGRKGIWKVENAPGRAGGTLRAIDPKGRFAPSRQVRFSTARGNTGNINLHLLPGAVISGTVRNDGGRVVPDATVYVGGVRSRTDDRGAFTLRGVPVGETTAAIRHPLHLPFKEKMTVPPGGARDLAVTLTRGALVTGTVRDERGDPIIGARVSARTPADDGQGPAGRHLKSIATGADGTFELGGFRADRFDVVVTAEGYEPERLRDLVPNALDLNIPLRPAPWVMGGDITGRLVDALTKRPIRNGTVERVDPERIVVLNDGFVLQNEPPGPCELMISAPGHQRHLAKGLVVPSGGTLDLGVIELYPCGELKVHLRDARNQPFHGPAKIRLMEKQVQRNPGWALNGERKGFTFVFPQLRPGRYEVIVTIEGRKPFRRLVVMDRPTVDLRMKLR